MNLTRANNTLLALIATALAPVVAQAHPGHPGHEISEIGGIGWGSHPILGGMIILLLAVCLFASRRNLRVLAGVGTAITAALLCGVL